MPLTPSRVISAAMDLMERDDRDPISMEALATHLGCSLVALYRCVPSTSALLDGVARVALTTGPTEAPGAGALWADQVAAHVMALRRTARTRPRGVLLAASRPPCPAPPGWPLDRAVAALRASGRSDQDCVRVARALGWYVLGSVLAPAEQDANADFDFDFGLTLLLRGAAAGLAGA